jgi:hypothetical protein
MMTDRNICEKVLDRIFIQKNLIHFRYPNLLIIYFKHKTPIFHLLVARQFSRAALQSLYLSTNIA